MEYRIWILVKVSIEDKGQSQYRATSIPSFVGSIPNGASSANCQWWHQSEILILRPN